MFILFDLNVYLHTIRNFWLFLGQFKFGSNRSLKIWRKNSPPTDCTCSSKYNTSFIKKYIQSSKIGKTETKNKKTIRMGWDLLEGTCPGHLDSFEGIFRVFLLQLTILPLTTYCIYWRNAQGKKKNKDEFDYGYWTSSESTYV